MWRRIFCQVFGFREDNDATCGFRGRRPKDWMCCDDEFCWAWLDGRFMVGVWPETAFAAPADRTAMELTERDQKALAGVDRLSGGAFARLCRI